MSGNTAKKQVKRQKKHDMSDIRGYKSQFLGKQLKVNLPQCGPAGRSDLARVEGGRSYILRYPHHSVVLSKKRKFPWFTAVNIDGATFQQINRDSLFPDGRDHWEVDNRVRNFQWGPELYTVKHSDFDRGHLVKREDPQWGKSENDAINAARSTFSYTNCVPQVADLNQREWRSLEDYILKKESALNKLKVSVFTGPVLADEDPVFVNRVKDEEVQIPGLFWKLVYFTNDGKVLSRVAFLMGQKKILLEREIVKPKTTLEAAIPQPRFFMNFEDAATYQVNVETIEKLTGLTFPPAFEPYTDDRAVKIVLKEVDLEGTERAPGIQGPGFELEGLVLR